MARPKPHRPVLFWSWPQRQWLRQWLYRVVLGAIVLLSTLTVFSSAVWSQTPNSASSSPSEAPIVFDFTQSQIPSVGDFWSPVGNYINSAPVYLDGRVLFRVAPTKSFSAKFRAEDIQRRLNQVAEAVAARNIQAGKTVDEGVGESVGKQPVIAVDNSGNQPVITVNDENLFTVTSEDAELVGVADPADRAEQLSQSIENALLQYRQERQPAYLKQQSYVAGGALLLMVILSAIFSRFQARIQRRKQRASQTHAVPINALAESTSSQEVVTALRHKVTHQQKLGILDFQRWLCQLGQVLIWAGGIFGILGLFPHTRGLQPLTLSLLKIPFKIALTILILYGFIRFSNVVVDRIALKLQERATLASMQSQRLALRFSTFSQVIKSISASFLVTIGVLSVLASLGLDLAPLLAGAGIVGLALSLASQNLLKDVINGFLILTEDQYGVGDVIVVGDVAGFVETMNLRITQLRNDEGRLITIPNSQIAIVQNLSKEWSRVDLRIPVSPTADIDQALELINHVAQNMRDDPAWKHLILEPPLLLGVDNLDYVGATVRIWIKTQPLKQWDVAREYRRRLKIAFDQTGINIGVPQQTLHVQSALPVINVQENGTPEHYHSADTHRQ